MCHRCFDLDNDEPYEGFYPYADEETDGVNTWEAADMPSDDARVSVEALPDIVEPAEVYDSTCHSGELQPSRIGSRRAAMTENGKAPNQVHFGPGDGAESRSHDRGKPRFRHYRSFLD